MITKYGVDVVIRFFALSLVVISLTIVFTSPGILRYSIFGLMGLAAVFVLNFFRDPHRNPPEGEGLVLAPADGKIVVIKDVDESEFIGQQATQISIFMSPLNVHVNRFPISGTVGYFQYIPGEYLVAFEEKSSTRNERTHIGVELHGYKVLFKQIAGAVARRIVADISVGMPATAGERFGMIKFGSRVDVIVPKTSVINVTMHQHVRAGETILATYVPAQYSAPIINGLHHNKKTIA